MTIKKITSCQENIQTILSLLMRLMGENNLKTAPLNNSLTQRSRHISTKGLRSLGIITALVHSYTFWVSVCDVLNIDSSHDLLRLICSILKRASIIYQVCKI